MNFHDRLGIFLAHLNMRVHQFEKKCEFSNGSLSMVLKEKRAIGHDRLEKIFNTFPELNPTWLLTGRQAMIISLESEQDLRETVGYMKKVISNYEGTIEQLNKKLEACRKKATAKISE